MESTIEKLYYGTINDGAEVAYFPEEREGEEQKIYIALHSTFSAEQRALFERYEQVRCDRQNTALERTYKKGFQRGARVFLEALKDKEE
ncbi:MAG: hypothetical protein IJX49_06200 [Clostridia bacterium]|nr:hypothetical protein [Clostridia bacterium]